METVKSVGLNETVTGWVPVFVSVNAIWIAAPLVDPIIGRENGDDADKERATFEILDTHAKLAPWSINLRLLPRVGRNNRSDI